MKSIIQEGSTIAKAVESGWKQAGEPQEFSVKILELPKHNFIGMTTQSAKVALMYHDTVQTQTTKTSQPQADQSQSAHNQAARNKVPKQKPVQETPQPVKPKIAPVEPTQHKEVVKEPKKDIAGPEYAHKPQVNVPREKSQEHKTSAEELEKKVDEKKFESLWNEELVAYAHDWLKQTISHFAEHDLTFTIEPQRFYLRITFNKPIIADQAKEKHLLASLSILMLATVKKHFRKALRGHKIILTHGS